jgi:hypothetical protein
VRPAAPQPVRFAIVPPSTQPLTLQGFQRDIAITPDGRHIVYRVGPAGTQGSQLVVRSLDQLDACVLPGISSIRSPFISPDGHWIGFFEGEAGGELKKLSISAARPSRCAISPEILSKPVGDRMARSSSRTVIGAQVSWA